MLNEADTCRKFVVINSPLGRAYSLSEKKQMTGQANVNATKLVAMPVWLPGLDEQRRLTADLDSLEEEIGQLGAVQTESSAALDALLPAVLDGAFHGEL